MDKELKQFLSNTGPQAISWEKWIEKLKQGLRDIKTNLKEMWIELHPKSKDEKCKYFLIVDKVITQINQVLGEEK